MADALDHELVDAYLDRLGLDAEAPSAGALHRLHRRHTERVAYETLWIHAGERWGLDPIASATRIARDGRGGYCYHLNGAFAALLDALGYDVRHHVGGVHGPDGPDPSATGNHLVLSVHGLPDDTHPAGSWYVDVGLGDALHDALPLALGHHRRPPFDLGLESDDTGTAWRLLHDPRGGFAGMAWTTAPAQWSDFEVQHEHLSSSPDSGFVRIGLAQCRDATGVNVMRGLVVLRIEDTVTTGTPILDRSAWFDTLHALLGLRFDATPAERRDELWTRTLATHRAWEDTGRP